MSSGPERCARGRVAAVLLGDLASRDVYPGVAIEVLFVHDGWQPREFEGLCRRFRKALSDLAQDSLLFSPISPASNSLLALPLSELAERCGSRSSSVTPVLTRARCVFESEDSEIGRRFGEARRDVLAECGGDDSLINRLRVPLENPAKTGVSTYAEMRGGLDDVERAARFLQLKTAGAGLEDSAPTAAAVFGAAGNEALSQAAASWRDLQFIARLVAEEGFDAAAAGPKVKSLIASACGHENFDALESAVAETASRAAAHIDTLLSRA